MHSLFGLELLKLLLMLLRDSKSSYHIADDVEWAVPAAFGECAAIVVE